MEKSIVSLVKGFDPDPMVEEALSLLGGVRSLIRPKSTVVIKPNAGHPGPPETSSNTNPEVVAAVIKEIRKAEPKEIILAESSAIGCDTLQCLEISGIGPAAQEAGVDRIIDIKKEEDRINMPIRDARSAVRKVSLPRFLIEADHIINLPIFKPHVCIVFTCALKNIKGVVQDPVHFQMHQTTLAEAIMDVWSVVRADLTIADLVYPMEGFGPQLGTRTDFGCIVAGRDPVAVDATIARMIGLNVEEVPYFEPALERGLGNKDEDCIEIRGKSIEEVSKKLYMPYLQGLDAWPEYNIHVENACSGCQGLVAFTMERLRGLGEYEKNKGINIIVGRKKELPEGVEPGEDLILIGDCTKALRKKIGEENCLFSSGCPPTYIAPAWVIMDRKNYDTLESVFKSGVDARERINRENVIFNKNWKPSP